MRILLGAVLGLAGSAHAFCGFYVAGGGAELFNNATQVVLMREGTKTVLSMQNNYQGPPENFAMVIPVPIVLQKENVKTLEREVFARIDQLAAPRLVEYWEQDPCAARENANREREYSKMLRKSGVVYDMVEGAAPMVKVEAQFTVGEYEIVVLSAKDALALEVWLKQNDYKIPAGAEPLFRPYIQQGMKFFVARVDATKVKFKDGMAMLSPLRFHYDSEKFELPVRLGLINAKEKQDLIIHILAKNQRYEVANFPNATIPTNIDLVPSAKNEFGPFYVSLFDRTLQKNPGAVITEYAWQATSCDPCPTAPLTEADMLTFGSDVLPVNPGDPYNPASGFVLTRLHARYDKSSLGEDLVFRAAKGIEGGREHDRQDTGLRQTAIESSYNNFQGRYAIRYPFAGEVKCSDPLWGVWGGNPNGQKETLAAQDTAFQKRDPELLAKLAEADVPVFELKGRKPLSGVALRAAAGEGTTPVKTKRWWEFWK
ncbi:MAG: DUF2330 domain-containing protein [Archangium sp.]|nr:DUF2330 domain-containing protein [Archangium sp.]MDP3569357.1 DUF2330 domain-containing protein [Archangium sp.]